MILTPAVLASARRAQESIMASRLVVRAPGDGWIWDEATQQEIPDPGTIVYDGPGTIQRLSRDAAVVVTGGQPLTAADYAGKVPWYVTGLAAGHTVEVAESTDPAILNQQFTIEDVELNGLAVTARRFTAEKDGEVDRD